MPGSVENRIIKGLTPQTAILGFYGTTNITVDGSFNGSGRYLTFNNISETYNTSSVFEFNSCKNAEIKNLYILGQDYNVISNYYNYGIRAQYSDSVKNRKC